MSRLRDRIMPGWLRQSEWLGKLRWHEQSLFYGLWNWVDDNGVFEARASVLRGGLYSTMMGKVSVGEIEQMLRRLHELGVVELYTVGGKGYGRIVEFKQKMKFHRAEHPLPPDMQGELGFTVPVGGADSSIVRAADGRPSESEACGLREVFEPQVSAKRLARNRSPERVRGELLREKAEVERELREILRPGGAAYNVTPTGEKKLRYDVLMARHKWLEAELKKLDALRREGGEG